MTKARKIRQKRIARKARAAKGHMSYAGKLWLFVSFVLVFSIVTPFSSLVAEDTSSGWEESFVNISVAVYGYGGSVRGRVVSLPSQSTTPSALAVEGSYIEAHPGEGATVMQVVPGSLVEFTAYPEDGFEFVGWDCDIANSLIFSKFIYTQYDAVGQFINTPHLVSNNSNFSTPPMVSSGISHALALRYDGTVWAWGANFQGRLGNGTTDHSSTPVKAFNLNNIISVSAGNHSLALRYDGSVWAWGGNFRGELGDGTNVTRPYPVEVQDLNAAIAVAAGDGHSIALLYDGTVWAWGRNHMGQIGDGTVDGSFAVRSTPTQVVGIDGVISIAAGRFHSVALRNDGTVWTWGSNISGELGDGTTANRSIPRQVQGLSDIIYVTAGNLYTLALRSDGTVWSWGRGWDGELGNGTQIPSSTPVQVYGLTDAISISAKGNKGPRAITADGAVWAWGWNGWDANVLGASLQTGQSSIPVRVLNLGEVVSIQSNHVLKSDGSAWAWGSNTDGQLGDGTTIHRTNPVRVVGHEGLGYLYLGTSDVVFTPPPAIPDHPPVNGRPTDVARAAAAELIMKNGIRLYSPTHNNTVFHVYRLRNASIGILNGDFYLQPSNRDTDYLIIDNNSMYQIVVDTTPLQRIGLVHFDINSSHGGTLDTSSVQNHLGSIRDMNMSIGDMYNRYMMARVHFEILSIISDSLSAVLWPILGIVVAGLTGGTGLVPLASFLGSTAVDWIIAEVLPDTMPTKDALHHQWHRLNTEFGNQMRAAMRGLGADITENGYVLSSYDSREIARVDYFYNVHREYYMLASKYLAEDASRGWFRPSIDTILGTLGLAAGSFLDPTAVDLLIDVVVAGLTTTGYALVDLHIDQRRDPDLIRLDNRNAEHFRNFNRRVNGLQFHSMWGNTDLMRQIRLDIINNRGAGDLMLDQTITINTTSNITVFCQSGNIIGSVVDGYVSYLSGTFSETPLEIYLEYGQIIIWLPYGQGYQIKIEGTSPSFLLYHEFRMGYDESMLSETFMQNIFIEHGESIYVHSASGYGVLYRNGATLAVNINTVARSGGRVYTTGDSVILGQPVSVVGAANYGYIFTGWYENGQRTYDYPIYNFTATTNRTLEARFAPDSTTPPSDIPEYNRPSPSDPSDTISPSAPSHSNPHPPLEPFAPQYPQQAEPEYRYSEEIPLEDDTDGEDEYTAEARALLDFPIPTPPQSNNTLIFVANSQMFMRNNQWYSAVVAPFIDRSTDRMMIPLRTLSEADGMEVAWDSQARAAVIWHIAGDIILPVGEDLPDGMGAVVLQNDRAFVPLRFAMYLLDANVEWDSATRSAVISWCCR